MDHKLNVAQLYNVPALLTSMLVHVMLSFNTNLLKYVSFVNFNDLVLLKLAHKLTFNNMVINFSMLQHLFHKLVLLVSSKISQLQVVMLALLVVLVVVLLVTVDQPMVKTMVASVRHQVLKAVATVATVAAPHLMLVFLV
jgi:hypothetical protein